MNGNEHSILETDARSRLAIALINRATSSWPAQLGDLSKDEFRGGFVSRDGQVFVSGDATFIHILPSLQSEMETSYPFSPSPYPVFDAFPQWRPGLPAHQNVSMPLTISNISAVYDNLPQLKKVEPDMLPDVLVRMTGQYDLSYLCHALKLDRIDYDNVRSGIFVRTFADNIVKLPSEWIPLKGRGHLWKFLRMYAFFQESLFEVKVFKFTCRPGLYPFLFRPEHPGIFFRGIPQPPGPMVSIILDTDVKTVLSGNSPANAGLINAGDITELDYGIILECRHKIQYLWHAREPESRNQFAEVFHLLADAKKKGIDASILRYDGLASTQENLDLAAARQQALRYGLDIPATLRDSGYVHVPTTQKEFVPRDIPFFWTNGSSTLFFGSECMTLMKHLLSAFNRISIGAQDVAKTMPKPEKTDMCSGVFPQKKVAIFYPAEVESLTDRLIRKNGGSNVPCISSAILRKEDALEAALLQGEIQVLFIVQADKLSENDLADLLELCERIGVVTGAFSAVEKEKDPVPGDVLKSSMMMELVEQKYRVITAKGDSANITNTETDKEERYTFGNDGWISVTEINTNAAKAKEK